MLLKIIVSPLAHLKQKRLHSFNLSQKCNQSTRKFFFLKTLEKQKRGPTTSHQSITNTIIGLACFQINTLITIWKQAICNMCMSCFETAKVFILIFIYKVNSNLNYTI